MTSLMNQVAKSGRSMMWFGLLVSSLDTMDCMLDGV